MSILPSKDLGSASSSSSQPPFQNPNFNHGIVHQQPKSHPQPQLAQSSPDHFQSLQSLQISDSTHQISGTVSPVADNACGSSKQVNGSGKRSGKKLMANQTNGRNSDCGVVAQGGIGSAQESEKPSESLVCPCTQGGCGSINFQASTTHLTGRKTQMVNGNHLLNFHYDPIARPQPRAPAPRRHQKRKPYNKDLFLQANYKFVVLNSRNYSPRLMDPDKMLSWEDIICVKFSTLFPVQCPICLDDPLCPQITSCGHIFCFPCILQYFSIGENDLKDECWKKCPLCFMMISSKDLYTIYIENFKQYRVGDTAEFMLLTRQKDSFSLYLKNKQGMDANEEAPDSFSKFTFTSDVDLSVRKAISDLDSWLARADSGLVDDLEKLPYICAAMEQLELRRKYWNEQQVCHGNMAYKYNDSQMELLGSQPAADHLNAGNEPCNFVWRSFPPSGNSKFSMDQNVDVVEQLFDPEATSSSSHDDGKSAQRDVHGFRDRKEKDSYNFYQAVDGQHLILHPLNMKCLLNHYGGYDMLPHRISGKILQLETVIQSEAMRRRYRFLSHFSLTTTFQLCEIDLSDSLPPDALSPFMNEIKNREKQRKRLERKEREEKMRVEVAATHFTSLSCNIPQHSVDNPPTFSMDDFEALGSSAVISSSPPTVGERKLFSNVARLGFAAGHDSPALRIDDTNTVLKSEVTNDSSGVTGLRNAGTPSFASIISREKVQGRQDAPKVNNEMARKGKKPNRVLLSTAGGRRY